jgi:ABC-type Fe3+ transport system permease subunit
MNELRNLMTEGGYVMIALLLLSLLLYERCFNLLLLLRHASRKLKRLDDCETMDLDSLHFVKGQLQGIFEQHMIRIRALVTAAPLLGLLGTVIGMINTFSTLADRSGEHTIQGLSDGISMALITTETGLAIAIPAVIILYYARRRLNEAIRALIETETSVSGALLT